MDTAKWLIGLGGAALLVEVWRTVVGLIKWAYSKRHSEKSLPEQIQTLEYKIDVLGQLNDKQYNECKVEFSKINSNITKIEKVLDRNGEGTSVCLKVNRAVLEGLKRHGYDLNGEGKEAEQELTDFLMQNTQNGLQL